MLVLGGLVTAGLGSAIALEYPLDRKLAADAALNLAFGLFAAVAIGGLLSRMLPRTPVLRHLVLQPASIGDLHGSAVQDALGERGELAQVGAKGTALTDLRPVGKVVLDANPGVEYEARAPAMPLSTGVRIIVVEARAGRLIVESLEPGERA